MMKIKAAMAKNFAAISEISVNFSDTITYLCGANGSGKTTLGLHLIWFVLQGLSQKGSGLIAERYRFIGEGGKSAKGTIEIQDEQEKVTHTVTRKLLKNKTELEIKSSDNLVRGQEFLDSLFSAILINPMHFSELSSKAQALALGIDTGSFDAKRKELEQDRLLVGREATRLQGAADSCGQIEKTEKVSIAGLLRERQEIVEFNEVVRGKKTACEQLQAKAYELGVHMIELQEQLQAAEQEHSVVIRNIIDFEKEMAQPKDLTEIDRKIEGAEDQNARARVYEKSLEDQQAAETKQAEYQAKKDEIGQLDKDRAKYLQDQKLPFSNITINEDGELRLNNKPFCQPYFSTGECLKFGAKIGARLAEKQGRKLDYIYIPDSQDLDEKNRETLFADLVKQGFQVVAEFVDLEKQKEGYSILLKESQILNAVIEREYRE
jgi:DNA repair exonuclease SbcCD ATPase subunit